MADFSYTDDPELHKLNDQAVSIPIRRKTSGAYADLVAQLAQPEEFENWEKLVRAAESQEGGLHRNSSPQAIAATRDTYDCFLARYPLFFGYWKKYADLEFAIGGTEAAEMVRDNIRIFTSRPSADLTFSRSTSAASLASAFPSISGHITAPSRWRRATMQM